jgi:ribosomal protein S18 acetylase RimI-like enzyme
MNDVHQTGLREYRFLREDCFAMVYRAFIEAFSDYVFPFALTQKQFQNHINLNAVDLSRTIGCLDEGRIVGFSLNGFGDWDGLSTVYDAGTGVVPSHRRQGISEKMFDHMVPIFRQQGIKQFLLEVITSNTPAIALYEKLGFKITRELSLLQFDGKIEDRPPADNIEIREIDEPDWEHLTAFWSGKPSWQNSVDAIKRSWPAKSMYGAFDGETCIGYLVFSRGFGRVAQLSVKPEYRKLGVATTLLKAMQDATSEGYSLQVINIDKSVGGAMEFFTRHGFYERLSQYEMLLEM